MGSPVSCLNSRFQGGTGNMRVAKLAWVPAACTQRLVCVLTLIFGVLGRTQVVNLVIIRCLSPGLFSRLIIPWGAEETEKRLEHSERASGEPGLSLGLER